MAFARSATAVPLRAWSDAQLGDFARRVHPAWEGWVATWSPCADSAVLTVEACGADAHTFATREWHAVGQAAIGGRAWLAGSEREIGAVVQRLLFYTPGVDDGAAEGEGDGDGEGEGGIISEGVRSEAVRELLRSLGEALGIELTDNAMAPDEATWGPWAGAVAVSLTAGDARLNLLLDGPCAARMCAPLQPRTPQRTPAMLSPIERAAGSQSVPLRALMAALELDLGTLTRLQVGDIVPLAHSLDEAIRLVDSQGQSVLHGFLGRSGLRRGLQLTSANTPAENPAS